ncbi:MAG: carboxy terminal-processing peptidase [Verrucomicrobia bacterium]|nr:carboxy terminal-processing peptidase [Verrucomicrobiota bacterium]
MKRILSAVLVIAFLCGAARAVEFTREQSGRIAKAVGTLLDRAHYKGTRLDDAIAEMHLKNYLDALDYNHMIFLQADVDEFTARLGKQLDNLTNKGDADPAYEIFDRYLQRLDVCVTRLPALLKADHDFTKDEKFTAQRNKLPWPRSEAESAELWRQRIKFELLNGRLINETPAKTAEKVTKRYARLQKNMKQFDASDTLQVYLSALGQAFDPHSGYMAPAEAKNFAIHNVDLKLNGIGALLGQDPDDDYTRIKGLTPGGPAELGKQVRPGDKIVAVAQGDAEPVDCVGMKLGEVVDMIRGKKGSEVRLTIIPADAVSEADRKVIRIIRAEIKLTEQYAYGRVIEHVTADGKKQRLGVIELPQFYKKCAADVEKLLIRLQKEQVAGVILDLRRNGGGLLNEAVELTGLFIKKGPVVQVRQPKSIEVLEDEDGRVTYDGPLMVFVGHHSASASEIVAAALQDYGRALIVGDLATHGKGTVQTLYPLANFMGTRQVADPGELKFTVSKFYRIAGGTTQKHGVTPDVILPNILDYLETGEAYLPNVLEADNIPPAKYQRADRLNGGLDELRKNSSGRIAKDQDFAYVREDIELVKKQRADKTISLSEPQRLKEKKDAEARVEARKKERDARPPVADKVFLVKTETVDKNQPLIAIQPPKPAPAAPKEAAAKGKATPPAKKEVKPPEDGDELEDTTDAGKAVIDAYLREALDILADYAKQQAKIGRGEVVIAPR